MRELITLAVDKGVAQEIKRLRELRLVPTEAEVQQQWMQKYEEERQGI